jgi:hypothetical protein
LFLKRELEALGFCNGLINGRAGRTVAWEILDFCRSAEIYDKCIDGPLVYET